jgi:hypothetical protein
MIINSHSLQSQRKDIRTQIKTVDVRNQKPIQEPLMGDVFNKERK